MIHQLLTLNHRLESWVYADALARTSATGFVADDVGRIAYQTDTGQYWRLAATTPLWGRIAASPFARLQTTPVSPTSTTSLTGVMAGLGGVITPAVTGRIMVTICGTGRNDTAGSGILIVMYYGTGTAPANGAALAGTNIGGTATITSGIANERAPFSLSAIITGLAVGIPVTPVWLDVSQAIVTSGVGSLTNVAISAFEIP